MALRLAVTMPSSEAYLFMHRLQWLKSPLRCTALAAPVAACILCQSLDPARPSKEYIRLGGQVVAIENAVATPQPQTLAYLSGSGQSAATGAAFANRLTAKVTDGASNGVSGVTVTFTAPGSGASAVFPGGATSVVATTDASGTATSPSLTANTVAGGYSVTASASGVTGTASFSLTNTSGGASAGQSIVWNGAAYSTVTLPASATFGSLNAFRLETRLHDFRTSGTVFAQYIWMSNGYYLAMPPLATRIEFGNRNQYYCSLSLGGATDITVRLQRDSAGVYTFKGWDNGTGQPLASFNTAPCGADTPPTPVNLSGDMWVGGVWAQDYFGSMAFLRLYNSAAANLSAKPPDTAAGGELLRYEFEAPPYGLDTSGSGYSLNIVGTPSGVATPGAGVPAVAISSPAANETVSGSNRTLTANAAAASGQTLANVQFKLNGANLGPAVVGTGPTFTTTWNTTSSPNGSYVLSAVATDTQGRQGTSAQVPVTVANVASNGQSIVWNGTAYGLVTLPAGGAYSALGGWRLELRLHDIYKAGTTWAQYVWMSNSYSLVIALNAGRIEFNNRNLYYCSLDLTGATDIAVRVQRDANGVYSLKGWNMGQNAQPLAPFSASTCGADAGAPPTNLSGDMWVGGVWAQDYIGSMAYLRFYDSAVANLALLPGNVAPGGELLRYEFETAGDLGRETSGSVPARPLSMAGTVSAVATP